MVQDLKGTRSSALWMRCVAANTSATQAVKTATASGTGGAQCPSGARRPPDAFDIEVRCTDRIGRSPARFRHSRSYGNAQPRLEPGGAETRTAPAATSGPPTRRGLTRYHRYHAQPIESLTPNLREGCSRADRNG